MEEGTILQWLKADGDEVKRGDELVEIETDKATMIYEADQDGVLAIVAQEGATLPIGDVIAHIGAPGAGAAAAMPEATVGASGNGAPVQPERAPAPLSPVAEQATVASAPAPPDPGGRVRASPVARRMAHERGLDLRALTGSGPGGRIVKADIMAAGDAPAPAVAEEPVPTVARAAVPIEPATAKGEVRRQELSRTQQLVARRMAESRATVPHFTLQAEIDMEQAVDGRAALKAAAGGGELVPSFNDMVVKACALALREFPRANGAYRDGHFELYSRVNVGVAVAAQDALVVPTVFDADTKSLRAIAADTRELAAKVRDATITPPELSGGTFTVSNLGMYGISNFEAVINPPQAAILAVGALEPKAVVRDGEVVARHTMGVTLACDHRILYGADAAEFLGRVRTLLEHPVGLAL
jgi:pyruvate dehydrogenase E2 component (dihydrolipoamide acetyltransferase)